MKAPRAPANESTRLAALADLGILDTAPEAEFDALARLTALLMHTPIALISFIDARRQWFKARIGLDIAEAPRELTFCGHVIETNAPMFIADARQDDRFHDNPFVTGDPQVRFYAGVPLRAPDGHVLGTLCAFDPTPRAVTPQDREVLELLAGQAVALIELRRRNTELARRKVDLETHHQFFELSLELMATANRQMHFVELNPAWETVLGWSREELRARPFIDFIHPDDLERTQAEAARLLRDSGMTIHFENRYRHKDGRYIPLSWTACVAGETFYAAARDMSAQYDAHEKLAVSERRLQAIFDSVIDAIVTIDETGTIERVNPAVQAVFGYEMDELIGQNVKRLVPAPDRDAHDGYLETYLRTGHSRIMGVTRETRGLRKSGTIFPIELTITENIDQDRRKFTGVIRDISERRRIQKLQADFVSTVSHELRTPLTSIRGSLGLLAAGAAGTLPAEAAEVLDIALRNSDRLARLVNDILDFEKLHSGTMILRRKPVDLVAVVKAGLTANTGFAQNEKVRLELTQAPRMAAVLGDEDRLIQVLANLISNAIKFSPDDAVVELAVCRRENAFEVTVADRGPGIPEEFRSRIFQRFSQADASTTRKLQGTGLGLSISKEIIEKHGGTIGFTARPGGGTVFAFRLPESTRQTPPGGVSIVSPPTQPDTNAPGDSA